MASDDKDKQSTTPGAVGLDDGGAAGGIDDPQAVGVEETGVEADNGETPDGNETEP